MNFKQLFTSIIEGLSLIKWIGSLISGISRLDRNKNNKIEREEVLLLLQEIVNVELFTILPNARESLRQIIKANPEERGELITSFAEKFDLDNDELELAIEKILSSGNHFSTDIQNLVKIISKSSNG